MPKKHSKDRPAREPEGSPTDWQHDFPTQAERLPYDVEADGSREKELRGGPTGDDHWGDTPSSLVPPRGSTYDASEAYRSPAHVAPLMEPVIAAPMATPVTTPAVAPVTSPEPANEGPDVPALIQALTDEVRALSAQIGDLAHAVEPLTEGRLEQAIRAALNEALDERAHRDAHAQAQRAHAAEQGRREQLGEEIAAAADPLRDRLVHVREIAARSARLATLVAEAAQVCPETAQAAQSVRDFADGDQQLALDLERALGEVASVSQAPGAVQLDALELLAGELASVVDRADRLIEGAPEAYSRAVVNHVLAIMGALYRASESSPASETVLRGLMAETRVEMLRPTRGEPVDFEKHEATEYVEGGVRDTVHGVKSPGYLGDGKVIKKAQVSAYMG